MAQGAAETSAPPEQGYEIRPYRSSDREDILSLFETVWDTDRSEDWLVATYENNPYFDGPPMIVADAGERVVGARPFHPFPMRAGASEFVAVYLNNAMVHPDHRRRGLFTELTDRSVDLFEEEADVAFLFNFANELSGPGYRKTGFQEVGRAPANCLRLQKPGRFIRDRLDIPLRSVVGAGANAAMRGYLSLRSRGTPTPSNMQVERYAGIPSEMIVRLYEDDPPKTLHARREESLYRWIESDPHWTYDTYVASVDGSPAAAMVVRDRPVASERNPTIVDAVPPSSPTRREVMPPFLVTVLGEYRDAPAISITGPVVAERLIAPAVLSAFGFVSSEHPLLSRFTAPTDTAFVYTFEDASGFPAHLDITDPENWTIRIR